MAQSIVMPALSAGMEEATIVRWLKTVGDVIAPGDLIAEIETDKATIELEAEQTGKIGRILAAEGATVAVNAEIALLLAEGEHVDDLSEAEKAAPETASVAVTSRDAAAAAGSMDSTQHRRIAASPLARRIAQAKGVGLDTLRGSGPHGRIVRIDVEAAISALPQTVDGAPAEAASISPPASRLHLIDTPYTEIPLTNIRKVIARRLTEAKATIPHFYLEVDCEIDELLKSRETLNARSDGQYNLSLNDLVIKAAALALRQVPEANTAWTDDAIIQFQDVDISVAVATDGGLITPIVRQADRRGLASISAEVRTLAARAREGRLEPAEFQGGSFTISNLGMFGVRAFSAIINPPQSCILAVGAAERRPVVRGEACVPATVMTCTLSVDHRAVDGVVGARYLAAFKSLIEQPLRLML
uniref:Acetyltransferase component of pyruvate dehydrogenase complex n=1 Tax=Caulobacter sp. (strain K31) TaxID=366602 RepID=B0T7H6_CAUSK